MVLLADLCDVLAVAHPSLCDVLAVTHPSLCDVLAVTHPSKTRLVHRLLVEL